VSESGSEGQPESTPGGSSSSSGTGGSPGTGGPSGTSGPSGTGGTSGTSSRPSSGNGQSGSRNTAGSRGQAGRGSDPVADFQRWLMKAGARSMANQVADQVKRTMGQERKHKGSGDVWDTATTELPPNEAPECQWCPVCQAARAARVSGPGLSERLAGAGGVLASVASDVFAAFEQAMKTQDQNRPAERTGAPPARPASPDRGETGQ
jgi:hypothetical protein